MSDSESTDLPAAADHALRVAVERVVRPVLCEELRKTRIRCELFGHTRDRYEDGVRRGLDPERAANEAVDRMGNAGELTAELQATVPWGDRWAALVNWVVRRRPRTPYWRHAAWAAVFSGGVFATVIAVVGVLTQNELAPNRIASHPDALRAMTFLTVTFAGTSAIGAYFGGRVRSSLASRANRLSRVAFGWAALGGVAAWLEGLANWLIVGAPGVMFSPVYGICWTMLSVALSVSMFVLSWLDIHSRREIEPWLSLAVE